MVETQIAHQTEASHDDRHKSGAAHVLLLTEAEMTELMTLLDIAVRAGGLHTARVAGPIITECDQAIAAAMAAPSPASPVPPEPASESDAELRANAAQRKLLHLGLGAQLPAERDVSPSFSRREALL